MKWYSKVNFFYIFFLIFSIAILPISASKPNISVYADGFGTGKAKFDKSLGDPISSQKISYSSYEIGVVYEQPIGTEGEYGPFLDARSVQHRVSWKENPHFTEKDFGIYDLSLGFFTNHVPDWSWKTSVGFKLDSDTGSFSNYARYTLMLWGRYDYSDVLGLHVGFLGQAGLKEDEIYPILGVDYKWRDDWHLNMIFPVKISAIYSINDAWSAFISARKVNTRHRVSKSEPLTKAIFEHKAYGGEVGVQFSCNDHFFAKIMCGAMLGGQLKVMNQMGLSPIYYDFGSGAYVGGNLNYSF